MSKSPSNSAVITLVVGVLGALFALVIGPLMLWGDSEVAWLLALVFLIAGPFALLPSALLALWNPRLAVWFGILCVVVLIVDLAAWFIIVQARLETQPSLLEGIMDITLCYLLPATVPHAAFIYLFQKNKPTC